MTMDRVVWFLSGCASPRLFFLACRFCPATLRLVRQSLRAAHPSIRLCRKRPRNGRDGKGDGPRRPDFVAPIGLRQSDYPGSSHKEVDRSA